MATGRMYSKFGEVRNVVFEIYERTDRQTDMLITILGRYVKIVK